MVTNPVRYHSFLFNLKNDIFIGKNVFTDLLFVNNFNIKKNTFADFLKRI